MMKGTMGGGGYFVCMDDDNPLEKWMVWVEGS